MHSRCNRQTARPTSADTTGSDDESPRIPANSSRYCWTAADVRIWSISGASKNDNLKFHFLSHRIRVHPERPSIVGGVEGTDPETQSVDVQENERPPHPGFARPNKGIGSLTG